MPDLSKESRLRILDVKLFNREKVNFETFSKYLEREYKVKIIERTFERDIRELRERLADRYDDDETKILCRDRDQDTYKYLKGYFAFEETALVKGTDLGKLLKYNPNFITDIETELDAQIAAILKEFNSDEDSKISWHPVVYQNKINEGQHNFGQILNYIIQQTPVEVTREPIGTKDKIVKNYILVLLKVIDNNFAKGWYVLAQRLNEGVREIELDVNNLNLIALDRIVKIKPLSYKINISYKENFNPNSYFDHSVKGIMRNNLNKKRKEHERLSIEELHKNRVYREPEKVSLVILDKKNWICNYFEKYPIHPSQFHRKDDKAFYIDLFVEVDMDLENLIYMYSKEIKVIEPLYLKNIIKERLQNALDNYE
jgi:hypothetical protein